MKHLVLCLLLCACGSDMSPGAENQGRELDGDGGKSPGDGDSARDPDGGQGDGDDDQGRASDAGRKPGEQNAGQKLGAEDASTLDDEEHCFFKSCPGDGISSVRSGETPYGTFMLQTVGAVYAVGFNNSTDFHLIGNIGGDYVNVVIQALNNLPEISHVVPPGTYTNEYNAQNEVIVYSTIVREGPGAVCSDQGVAGGVELTIEEHVAPQGTFERGTPLKLRGTIKITGSGWNLTAPFNIDTLCDRFTVL